MIQKPRFSSGLIVLILLVLVMLNLTALSRFGWPVFQNNRFILRPPATVLTPGESTAAASPIVASQTPDETPVATPSLTPNIPTQTAVPILSINSDPRETLNQQGVLLTAIRDGKWVHLFAYYPGLLPLTRLTSSLWDEIDPAVSPDGTQLAFASRQNGYWDLYIRDLSSGAIQRVTDTPEYEGKPSWSPDGQWLAFESFRADNLDIYLISLADQSQAALRLTEDHASESSPAWSPQGRKVAFISMRNGESAVWLADLDQTDDSRFRKLFPNSQAVASNPVWSHDGRYLAWTEEKEGNPSLVVWDSQNPDFPAVPSGPGERAAWTPDNRYLFSSIEGANQTGLAVYEASSGRISSPLISTPGRIFGSAWKPGPLEGWLADAISRADHSAPPPLSIPKLSISPNQPAGRMAMVTIPDVSAPVPMLSDAVDEPFKALREAAAHESGWDVLSSLEYAFIPMTTPNDPSINEDWLYTGRAFAINPVILSAGWMAIIREEINGLTYWRVYLKARYQDGSAGMPLTRPVWDINARFAGDPAAYERGGQTGSILPGYWIDLTELSREFGWDRLPSHTNWRTFFPAIRFNQFVYRGALDWNTAMRELYPPEALASPTSVPTPTQTPTSTRAPTRTKTVFVPSATPTITPTRRPTLTLAK